MIITVTMNPAIDKTGTVEGFRYGKLNRIRDTLIDSGGKGINVSKAIKSMGGKSVAVGFIGGNNGVVIERDLKYRGIKTDFTIVNEETRCNLKLVDEQGIVTEINEQGPVVDDHKMEVFLHKLQELIEKDCIVVLSGSLPNGADRTMYRRLIEMIHERGGKVFLDADGEAFFHGLEAKPEYIKPNRYELQSYFGKEEDAGREELIEMCRNLRAGGIANVLLTLGAEGALVFTDKGIIDAKGLDVEVKSSVGAGDSFLAAYALGVEQCLDTETIVKKAVAASAGAVLTEGTNPPSPDTLKELEQKVHIEYITEETK